jgi:hypothetical protein
MNKPMATPGRAFRIKRIVMILYVFLAACGQSRLTPAQKPTPQPAAQTQNALPQVAQDGIGLGMVGNSQTAPSEEPGKVKVVWGSNYATPTSIFNIRNQIVLGYDKPYDGILLPLSWWQKQHPTWVEYHCDGSPITPLSPYVGAALDFTNPAVRQYIFQSAAEPALNDDYPAVSADNVILFNYTGFCGHYDANGKFIRQFDGTEDIDAKWTKAVMAYISDLRYRTHAAGGLFAINYFSRLPAQQDDEFSLIDLADLVFYETGFTNSGSGENYRPSENEENAILQNALAVQEDGKCYFSMNKVPTDYPNTSSADLTWIMANYLLIKGPCTYLWIGGKDQYGYLNHYPIYNVDYGTPLDSAVHEISGVWVRHYTHATVTVDPTGTASIVMK